MSQSNAVPSSHPTQSLAFLVRPLLRWYAQNKRTLPWRENTNAYCVWVSEIMLQQTRVEAAKPYYTRFMHALPTVQSLAQAKEDELLKLWEGLGYYARARNLQKAAQLVCAQHNGQIPNTRTALLALPGIGVYTAGAIASIAFGQAAAAVDGNVLRVISRVTEDYREVSSPAFKAEITSALEAVYPQGECGAFTQSLMELGALVCTPSAAPHCELCPLSTMCKAHLQHTVAQLPVKKPKPPRKCAQKTVFILQAGDKMAIEKRKKGGLLGGMWQLPNADGALTLPQAHAALEAWGITPLQMHTLPDKKHVFTHIEWQMHAYCVQCQPLCTAAFTWADCSALEHEIALPTAFRQFLN